MIAKKICLLGAFSVGKTSLVERFVSSVFSDRYISTVGVNIKKKGLTLDGEEISLVLWDMEGKDEYGEVNFSYLRGAMGFFLVADGLRRETLDIALQLRERALSVAGNVPHLLLLNKSDSMDHWEITPQDVSMAEEQGVTILHTSAKNDLNVENAFTSLAQAMLGGTR